MDETIQRTPNFDQFPNPGAGIIHIKKIVGNNGRPVSTDGLS